METLNYKVLEGTGYNGYILKDAPVKVMQFGEGNFLRAFVDYFYDIANEKAGYNGKVKVSALTHLLNLGARLMAHSRNMTQME